MADKLACICQICTCGQHRCPHQPHSNIMNRSPQPCTRSEYTQQFKKYSARPRKAIKPARRPIDCDSKMACETINRNDFTPHPVTPRIPQPPAVYKSPEGIMSSDTEYRQTFEGKLSRPAVAFRPVNARKDSGGSFNHKTTQATDFVTFQIPVTENFAIKRAYEPPKEPLETKSTVQNDFVDFGPVKPPASLKPSHTPKLSTDPFDGSSCYRQCFTPQPIPARYQHMKAVYKQSPEQFAGSSTYTREFPSHTGRLPAPSMKPPQNKIGSDIPFDGATMSRLSYRSWDLPPKHVRPPTVYSPPKEVFAKQSTFQTDFPDYGCRELTKPIRPQPRAREEDTAAFHSVTTQRADFQLWDPSNVQPSTPIRQGGNYEPSPDKFSAVSTFRDHYKGTPGMRAASTKPALQPLVATEAMGNDTTYKDSFSSSGFTACPVANLSQQPGSSTTGFDFSYKNAATGHLYYKPVMPTATATATQVPELAST